MTGWTAVLPIKRRGDRKSRLAAVLSPEERDRLTHHMLQHAFSVVAGIRSITSVATLSFEDCGVRWFQDQGRGLNPELAVVSGQVFDRLLVLNPDLPGLGSDDITALIDHAGDGAAIAPDRHGRGTNALALRHPDACCFAFGQNSFALHRARLLGCAVVERTGLGFDIDLPEDLGLARERGLLRWPSTAPLG